MSPLRLCSIGLAACGLAACVAGEAQIGAMSAAQSSPAVQERAGATVPPAKSEAERAFDRLTRCTIEPLGPYVGRVLTPALQEEVVAAAQAASVRIEGAPGEASLEGRPGRLTIAIDGQSRILRFACE